MQVWTKWQSSYVILHCCLLLIFYILSHAWWSLLTGQGVWLCSIHIVLSNLATLRGERLLSAKYKQDTDVVRRENAYFLHPVPVKRLADFLLVRQKDLDLLKFLWPAGCVLRTLFFLQSWVCFILLKLADCMFFCSWFCLLCISFYGWSRWGFIGRKTNPFLIWTDCVYVLKTADYPVAGRFK